jgi:hypothetical protein
MWEQEWMNFNPFYYTEKLSVIKNSNPNFIAVDGMLMSADRKILFRCVNDDKEIVVKDGVETIAQGAFCGRGKMEKVILPGSLMKICNDAFSGCHSIDNIVIPEGVSSIGVGSFEFCRNLKTMKLPSSLKEIGPGAFEHSDKLQNFIYPEDMEEQFNKMMEGAMCDLPF